MPVMIEDQPQIQTLFAKHGLRQVDLTRILARCATPRGRSYAHAIWHGRHPPSANVILALRQAIPHLTDTDLVELMRATRQPSVDHKGDLDA